MSVTNSLADSNKIPSLIVTNISYSFSVEQVNCLQESETRLYDFWWLPITMFDGSEPHSDYLHRYHNCLTVNILMRGSDNFKHVSPIYLLIWQLFISFHPLSWQKEIYYYSYTKITSSRLIVSVLSCILWVQRAKCVFYANVIHTFMTFSAVTDSPQALNQSESRSNAIRGFNRVTVKKTLTWRSK